MAKSRLLTALQAKFARNYAQSHNGADAARKAGYSPESARIAASKALARPQVRAEVARLCLIHMASPGRVPTGAKGEVNVISAEKNGFDTAATAARILEEMSERVAEQLARHWLVTTLIRNIKIAMAEIPVRQTQVRTRRKRADGSAFFETTVIEVYERDAGAVVASAKLLLEECDRREAKDAEIKAADEQNAGPSLGARLLERAYGKLPPVNRKDHSERGTDPQGAPDLPEKIGDDEAS
jgi:hypothetical protein